MLNADLAVVEAIAEAEELVADKFWRAAYDRAVPALTVLVRNLNPAGHDYFIVNFRKQDLSTGRMVVNRLTGVVEVATGVEIEGEALPEFIAPTEVGRRLKEAEVVLEDGRIVHLPSGAPTIVVLWQHCRESQTMLQPFYWLQWSTLGLFLRTDGRFFDRLTPTDGMPIRVAFSSGRSRGV
jgi:hypothetical protein